MQTALFRRITIILRRRRRIGAGVFSDSIKCPMVLVGLRAQAFERAHE